MAFSLVLFCWPVLFLTFPDGRLPSTRWRPVLALLVVVTGSGAAVSMFSIGQITDPEAFLATTSLIEEEGVKAGGDPYLTALAIVVPIFVILLLLSAASLIQRLRRARGAQRRQIKFVVYTGVAALLLFPVDFFLASSETLATAQQMIGALTVPLLAAGFGVALLKYRLWDIDLALRRSLVYGTLWLLIAGIYLGAAAGLGLVAERRVPVALAIAVTVLATLVLPTGANGLSLRHVVDARVFLAGEDPKGDYRGFERAWKRVFEPSGHWPSMNLIPSRQANGLGGIMMPDLIVEIDLTVHRGHGG